jgi:hypothetical protein
MYYSCQLCKAEVGTKRKLCQPYFLLSVRINELFFIRNLTISSKFLGKHTQVIPTPSVWHLHTCENYRQFDMHKGQFGRVFSDRNWKLADYIIKNRSEPFCAKPRD